MALIFYFYLALSCVSFLRDFILRLKNLRASIWVRHDRTAIIFVGPYCSLHKEVPTTYEIKKLITRFQYKFTKMITCSSGIKLGPLSAYDLHDFRPSASLSDDVNYMDIVMIITRCSTLRQGSMGCLLVQPSEKCNQHECLENNDETNTNQIEDNISRIFNGVIAAANNTSLFQADDSDVHAEINAIGQVAKFAHLCRNEEPENNPSHATNKRITTQGSTAYITMPPCKKCFGALHAAGVTRIVSRRQASKILLETSAKIGIELVCLTSQEIEEQKVRLDSLFAGSNAQSGTLAENESNPSAEEILRRRKQRKEEQRAKKKARAESLLEHKMSDA